MRMTFKCWLGGRLLDEMCLVEAASYKGVYGKTEEMATRIRDAIQAFADSHGGMQSYVDNLPKLYRMAVNTIRHRFTNYENEWRVVGQAVMGKEGDARALSRWSYMIDDFAKKVVYLIKTYMNPGMQGVLLAANEEWRLRKRASLPTRLDWVA